MLSPEVSGSKPALSTGLFIVGLFCNLVTITVLRKRNSLGTRLLLYLSCVDVAVLLLIFFNVVLRQYFPRTNSKLPSYECLNPMFRTIYTLEVYLTVLVAVQRCCIMAMPQRFIGLPPDSVFNRAFFGIGILSIVYNLPLWTGPKPGFYRNERINQTLITKSNETIMYTMYEASRTPVDSFLPLVLILTCDIFMVFSRYRASPISQDKYTRGKNHLNDIVVSITTVSVFLHMVVTCLCVTSRSKLDHKEEACYHLAQISAVIIFLNSVINFFIYCMFGPEFRKTLISLFRRNANRETAFGLGGYQFKTHALD